MTTLTRTRTAADFRAATRPLAARAAALYERAEAGEPMTERDVALAAEYLQQYVDLLDEMLDAPIVWDGSGRVKFE